MRKRKVTRRDFVRESTAAAVAGAMIGGTSGHAMGLFDLGRKPKPEDVLNHHPNMQYRRMGKTDLWISSVGFGGHWKRIVEDRDGNKQVQRYWGIFQDDKLPPEALANREAAFAQAVECGINYLDITTPAEAAIYGQAMKNLGVKMHVGYSDHILCMRNPDNRNVDALMREIDEGLRRLQVGCIEIFREQADMGGRNTDDEVKVLIETFLKAREQGKVKHLGVSSHSRPWLIHIVETFPEIEMVIFPFPFGARLDPRKSLFKVAGKNDVGIACIKPFNGGSLFRTRVEDAQKLSQDELAALVLRRTQEVEEMTCILPGMTLPSEVVNASRCAKAPGLSDEERQILEEMGGQAYAALPDCYAWLRDWATV
jgi:predicted aldo/keto reductase-like oxidoreductase